MYENWKTIDSDKDCKKNAPASDYDDLKAALDLLHEFNYMVRDDYHLQATIHVDPKGEYHLLHLGKYSYDEEFGDGCTAEQLLPCISCMYDLYEANK